MPQGMKARRSAVTILLLRVISLHMRHDSDKGYLTRCVAGYASGSTAEFAAIWRKP